MYCKFCHPRSSFDNKKVVSFQSTCTAKNGIKYSQTKPLLHICCDSVLIQARQKNFFTVHKM